MLDFFKLFFAAVHSLPPALRYVFVFLFALAAAGMIRRQGWRAPKSVGRSRDRARFHHLRRDARGPRRGPFGSS